MEEALQRKLNKRSKKKVDIVAPVQQETDPKEQHANEPPAVLDTVSMSTQPANSREEDPASPQNGASSPPLTFQKEPAGTEGMSSAKCSENVGHPAEPETTSHVNLLTESSSNKDDPQSKSSESVKVSDDKAIERPSAYGEE